MYRYLDATSPRELPLGMLFEPTGDGNFGRACEADSWRGLVAAIAGDPSYEAAGAEDRLVQRLRLARDAAMLLELEDRKVQVADRDGIDVINVASDEALVRSLHRLGVVSLEPGLAGGR
ncbi:MAG: hypothetical protein ACYDGR_12385 [Candidatus Dormibacteria bacterium]